MSHLQLLALFLSLTHKGYDCYTDQATNLATTLFNGYETGVLGKCGSTNATEVRIDLAMRQVIELDEPQQILKLNLWIRLKWVDCRLTWDPASYDNTTSLVVPYKNIWTPDITLYDSVSSEFVGLKEFRPTINSDGTVYYNFPTLIDSLCSLDVTDFPYDSQTCKLVFGSWSHHGLDLDLVYKNPYGDLSSTLENVEWKITSFTAKRSVVYYGCCPEPYPDVTYYLTLKRKPTYYVNNIIIPSFLITTIAILGFILPVESGEKVSLQMTVMLSLAVFQLLVADSLPPSDATPLIGSFFNFSLFLVGFACAMAVTVLVINHQGSRRKVPHIINLIFLQKLSRVLCLWDSEHNPYKAKAEKPSNKIVPGYKNSSVKPQTNGTLTVSDMENEKSNSEVTRAEDKPEPEETPLPVEKEWEMLAIVVDKISCVIFLVILAIGTGVIFSKFQQ